MEEGSGAEEGFSGRLQMPSAFETVSIRYRSSICLATDTTALQLLSDAVSKGIQTPVGRAFLRRAWTLSPADAGAAFLLEIAAQGEQAARFDLRRRVLELPLFSMLDIARHYQDVGEQDLAEKWTGRLLDMAPSHASAESGWNFLAGRAYGRQHLPRARRALQRALALAPDWHDLHSNLSEVERIDDSIKIALRSARRAIALAPESVEALENFGLAMSVGPVRDGVVCAFRRTVALAPSRTAAYVNLSSVLLLACDYGESVQSASRGLALDGQSYELLTNLGFAKLCQGDLKGGFDAYELRLSDRVNRSLISTRVDRPRWQGEPLVGKTILIWGEQGIGDQFFFGRYLQFIDAAEAHVVLEVEPRLVTLFKRAFPQFDVLGESPKNAELFEIMPIDFQIAMGSLPGLMPDVNAQMVSELGTELSSFDPQYLFACPLRRSEIAADLRFTSTGTRIAVSWRGGISSAARKPFYMSVAEFSEMFTDFDGTVVNVQYNHTREEVALLRQQVKRFIHPERVDLKNDLEGVAAILAECDLLITADTAVCWLGAALGIPVRTFVTGGQWTSFGTRHCPAFPNMRCYWRGLGENWNNVISEIRSDLA